MIQDYDKELFLSLTKLIQPSEYTPSNSSFLMWVGSAISHDLSIYLDIKSMRCITPECLVMEAVFSGVEVSLEFDRNKWLLFKCGNDSSLFPLDSNSEIKECRQFILGFSAGCNAVANKGV